jgi:hypothetical protein
VSYLQQLSFPRSQNKHFETLSGDSPIHTSTWMTCEYNRQISSLETKGCENWSPLRLLRITCSMFYFHTRRWGISLATRPRTPARGQEGTLPPGIYRAEFGYASAITSFIVQPPLEQIFHFEILVTRSLKS